MGKSAVAVNKVRTTCPYCGVGCGVEATVDDVSQFKISVEGNGAHPANYGRLCSKGAALADTVSLQGRLLYPDIAGRRCSWDDALDHVAQRFRRIIEQHGTDALAFYVSGQLLTEDYYVANKLMKGFIGSANIDTNSRLCMSSAVVGHKRAFGADSVPGNYEDLEQADLLVFTGSNAAWCHPVLFQRMRKAKERNPALKIVVIDPRKTQTCDIADLHLSLQPGTDAGLFNGLLVYLDRNGKLNEDFIAQHTEGFEDALAMARDTAPSSFQVAQDCGLQEQDVARFFTWYAQTEKTVTLFSQGVNQSSSGADKCNALINCHLATGRIGKVGAGPFSLTGQPNAMGGREVGGLANTLAAHMELDNPAHVQRVARFWGSDHVADSSGLKAVELFDAVADGKIKAVWIMATNPVVSLPNADLVKQALKQCELVVVSDCIAATDTTELAHVRLPATGWGEQDGTVTNSERRISRQRSLFPPSGEARPDWWIICQIARRMGFSEGFNFSSSAEIFREHAALSAFENDVEHGLRDFNLAGLQHLTDQEYERLEPLQWPVPDNKSRGTSRLFGDGQFYTGNGKARFIAVQPRPPVNRRDATYPLTLNTGRIRDQWHTMTRTALSPRLNSHKPEPFIEIHPDDAARCHIAPASLACVTSRWGRMIGRVDITDSQQLGSVFVPMHWGAKMSLCGRVGALVNPVVDPLSGQPESKQTPVSISPYNACHYLFILSRNALLLSGFEYQTCFPGAGFMGYQLATECRHADLPSWARALLGDSALPNEEWLEYNDPAGGVYRAAQLSDGQLQRCIFIACSWQLPDTGWLQTLFAQEGTLSQAERLSLLSAKPPKGQADVGRTVCSCFGVGEITILQAIKQQSLTDVDGIGRCLGAGTGCGSCLPELKALLNV